MRLAARFPSTVAAFAVLSLVLALLQSLPAQAASAPSLDSAGFGPVVRESLHNDLSAPLSSIIPRPQGPLSRIRYVKMRLSQPRHAN